ncbi:MAG: hypothetical protein ICV72_11970 [Aldersonia sp.]|nr:hypothetical protein [Aldersonia sp.]
MPAPGLDRVDDVLAAARAAGLDVTLRADVVAPTLPSKVSNAAYRVVQESVSNVVTHSDARSVFVDLRCADEELVVMVSDDGRGRTDAADRAGWGITGMRERVSLLGGRLLAGNRAAGGFAVEAHLPLRQHA